MSDLRDILIISAIAIATAVVVALTVWAAP